MTHKPISFSIKQWSDEDRPREKLLKKGTASLSDAELIAILIGSGNKQESAVALSKRILAQNNNQLNTLGKQTIQQLMQFKGIGEAKAISIAAALELGKRRRSEQAAQLPKIMSSKTVFELLQPTIGELPHEEFWILYLNNANKVLQSTQLSKGGITGTLVDVRLALKHALTLGAVAVILAHNHPSGTLQPSTADVKLTQKMQTACNALDIAMLDHLIITEKTYFSFADEGLL